MARLGTVALCLAILTYGSYLPHECAAEVNDEMNELETASPTDETQPTTTALDISTFKTKNVTHTNIQKINNIRTAKSLTQIYDNYETTQTNATPVKITKSGHMLNHNARQQNIEASHKETMDLLTGIAPPILDNSTYNSPFGYGTSIVSASDVLGLASAISNINEKHCRRESERLLDGILKGQIWALRVFDSSAKSPQGLLVGSTYHLGNFDECVSINTDYPDVRVQYCLATIKLFTPEENVLKSRRGPKEDINWAICLPSVCSAKSLEIFVTEILMNTAGNTSTVHVQPDNCYMDTPLKVNSLQIGYAATIAFFLTLATVCTIYDVLVFSRKKTDGKTVRMGTAEECVLMFSVLNNMKKLFGVKHVDPMGLDCVAGIKAISMLFIVAGHTCVFIAPGPVMDSRVWDGYLEKVIMAFMFSNSLLVDTFLMISAFLFCRILLPELDKGLKIANILVVYIVRYLRLTPVYLIVIGFYITWMDKISSGPLWNHKMNLEKERCIKSWWTNILYVNNYVNTENMCMFQSWYLSVDTQLFILAPLIIIPLHRWKRGGTLLLGVVGVVSTIIPIIITYVKKWDPTLLIYAKEFEDITSNKYYQDAYIKTHMKANAYVMGILVGYLVHNIQKNGYKLSMLEGTIGWTIALAAGLGGGLSVNYFYQPDYVYEPIGAAMYSGFQRLAWCIFIGWLIVACIMKKAGLVGKLLSWKALLPFSRLSYCAYLINGFIELYSVSVLRQPRYISFISLMSEVFGHFILTVGGAIVLTLFFESPIHRFEKLLLRTVGERSNTTSKQSLSEETG